MRSRPSLAVARPSWRALQLLVLVSVLLCISVVYVAHWSNADLIKAYFPGGIDVTAEGNDGTGRVLDEEAEGHPIRRLIETARTRFNVMLKDEAINLDDAAVRYRKRRGRHPPPGFDAWYAYATERGAVVIESFFDQIYSDLAPFWGMDVYDLRHIAQTFSPRISIRGGGVDSKTKNSYERSRKVMHMLQTLADDPRVDLPDMDIPLNVHEEPAMLVPWENADTALSLARPLMLSLSSVVDEYKYSENEDSLSVTFDPGWLDGRERHTAAKWFGPRPAWSLVKVACPPHSPGRLEPLLADIWHPQGHTKQEHSAASLLPMETPYGTKMSGGYAENWTIANDVCQFPNLQGLHGAFVAPESIRVTQKLFPLFSSSKISTSNEILIPSVSDWNTSSDSTLSIPTWSEREGKLFWRGPATGGKNNANNWRRFHRHRFVSMLNATHVEIAEGLLHAGNETTVGVGYGSMFRLLPGNEYKLATQKGGSMADWVNGWADVAFTDVHCSDVSDEGACPYATEYFSIPPTSNTNRAQHYKYGAVVDSDGGDDGGVFLQSLHSGKVMLKASIYRQWYDSRLIPWLHFVPLDNTFVDLYGVMEYFVGTKASETSRRFPHAHVEMEMHEHHFQTPHWDETESEEQEHTLATSKQHVEDVGDAHTPETTERRDEDVEAGHDERAKDIADASLEWAQRVLRREDMLIYVYRLLLEYARVIDIRRDRLGWVEDLVGKDGT